LQLILATRNDHTLFHIYIPVVIASCNPVSHTDNTQPRQITVHRFSMKQHVSPPDHRIFPPKHWDPRQVAGQIIGNDGNSTQNSEFQSIGQTYEPVPVYHRLTNVGRVRPNNSFW
jgi:hypothetical protein